MAGAEFFVKVAVECIHYSLDVFASTCFAYQQIITIYVHYHFNTLHSFEDIFPTLRMVLYKKTTVCVLVHPQLKH